MLPSPLDPENLTKHENRLKADLPKLYTVDKERQMIEDIHIPRFRLLLLDVIEHELGLDAVVRTNSGIM